MVQPNRTRAVRLCITTRQDNNPIFHPGMARSSNHPMKDAPLGEALAQKGLFYLDLYLP